MDSTEAGLGKGIRAANSDNRKPPLRRRTFLSGATAATALSWPGSGLSQTAERATRVRLSDSRIMSARRSYSYNIIADPTGSAPTDRIERFELRGGDCPTIGRDCVPRPFGNGRTVQRTRTEKVIETRLRDGDEGLFRYWLYLPSAEFNFVDSVNTALGQLLAARGRVDNYDSYPVLLIDTGFDNPGGRTSAFAGEAMQNELDEQRRASFDFGNYHRDGYLRDNWFPVEIRFGLFANRDGYIQPRVNGRSLGRFEGRTILRGGWLEIRYGIYQTGTNFFPGGSGAVPTQVAYFSGADLLKFV